MPASLSFELVGDAYFVFYINFFELKSCMFMKFEKRDGIKFAVHRIL